MTRMLVSFSVLVAAAAIAHAGCSQSSSASPGHAPPAAAPVTTPSETPPVVEESAAVPDPVVPAAAATAAESAAIAAVPAAEPAKPAPPRPPADRGPSRPGEAEKITFDDLNLGMREDMVYRPFLLTDRVKELDGKRLSIIGYMHAGATKNAKEFVLLKNTECKFGPGGQADHLAQIYLAEGTTISYTAKPVKVEATLKVEPYEGTDGNTWAIYRLEDAKATIVR